MKEYFRSLSDDLFKTRKNLIDAFENEDVSLISPIITDFQRFERFPFNLESLVKAYGMMKVTYRLESITNLFRMKVGPGARRMFVVQIDGGYPFAFWWNDLVRSPYVTNLKKRNVYISGVSQGDGYYPVISAAGAIAYTMSRYPKRTYFLPIHELNYDEKFPISEDFYKKHAYATIKPTFEFRIIFLGRIDINIRTCLPYCVHRKDRKKTYEPFDIQKSVENFFKEYGPGNPGNTFIIYGSLLTSKDKQDLKYCQGNGYTCQHISEFHDHFEDFIKVIEDEIDLLPIDRRKTMSAKLEKIKESCLTSLR